MNEERGSNWDARNNASVRIKESCDDPTLATYRPSASFDPKGKGKTIMLDNEEEAQSRQLKMSFEERKNKVYTFLRDKVAKLFQQALKSGRLTLPQPTRPE